jgi:predicted RNA-binding protein
MNRNYWLIVFTPETWEEFLNAGVRVYGFTDQYKKTAEKTKPGDYLICYVTKKSQFNGILEVDSAPFRDLKEIWSAKVYPVRLHVKPVKILPTGYGIPISQLKEKLSIFQNLKTPTGWTWHFWTSIKEWKEPDAKAVIEAITKAKKSI